MSQNVDIQILFLCVANSARSQMAEGLAKIHLSGVAKIMSAGSKPSHVHPLAIAVLREKGIDISKYQSKSVQSLNIDEFDLVITLCHDEVCPILPTYTERLHWPTPDPAKKELSEKEQLVLFRQARDFIEDQIIQLRRRLVTGIHKV